MIRSGWKQGRFPDGPFTLNRNSLQADGLALWWPGFARHGTTALHDYSGRGNTISFAGSNDPAWVDTEWGTQLDFTRSSSQRLLLSSAPVTTTPLTLSAWVKGSGGGQYQEWAIVSVNNSGSLNSGFLIKSGDWGATAAVVAEVWNQYGNRLASDYTTTPDTWAEWSLVTGVFPSSTLREIYRDGQYLANDTSDWAPDQTIDQVTIGAHYGAGAYASWYADLLIADVRIYSRSLSAAEVWQLYDPRTRWDLYAPTVPRVWVVGTATSGAQTVTVTPGTLTLTGVASTITPGATSITVTTGTATLTGIAATISSTVTVSVTPGTLTLAGVASTITPGAVSVAATLGALTFAGVAAAVSATGVITVAPATKTITGQAVTVTPGAVSVAVTPGTASFAGVQSTITPGAATVAVTPGAMSFSGVQSTITPGAISVSVTPGAATITGVAASISNSLVVAVSPASLTLSGVQSTVTPGETTVVVTVAIMTILGITSRLGGKASWSDMGTRVYIRGSEDTFVKVRTT